MDERIFSIPERDIGRVEDLVKCLRCGATFPQRDFHSGKLKLQGDRCPACPKTTEEGESMIGISGSREPFVPYRTMFKQPALLKPTGLRALRPSPPPVRDSVFCVECGDKFPLSDLLSGELEEDHCPHCNTTADEYWAGIPSHPVPRYN